MLKGKKKSKINKKKLKPIKRINKVIKTLKKTIVKSKAKSKSKSSIKKQNPKSSESKFTKVYFDNNATTKLCNPAKNELMKYIDSPNISSSYREATNVRDIVESGRNYILGHCKTDPTNYTCIFNSGATEGNNFIIRSVTESFSTILDQKNRDSPNKKPHVIVSSVEHKSILECCEILQGLDKIEYSILPVNIYGQADISKLPSLIRPETCLICVMFANNELGTLMPIRAISNLCSKNKIFFHCDCVQVFGKYIIDLTSLDITSISFSFHKFYGPKQIGGLIIKNDALKKYNLHAQIAGSQEFHLRGGTQNPSLILSGIAALKDTFIKRTDKNVKLLTMRNHILDELNKHFTTVGIPILNYDQYHTMSLSSINEESKVHNPSVVILSPPADKINIYLHNTILLSFVYKPDPSDENYFCNGILKDSLEEKKIIVSVGSACNTQSKFSSHVLTAIGSDKYIKKGTLRISLGDTNTIAECTKFAKAYFDCVMTQYNNLRNGVIRISNIIENETEEEKKKNIKRKWAIINAIKNRQNH